MLYKDECKCKNCGNYLSVKVNKLEAINNECMKIIGKCSECGIENDIVISLSEVE